MHHNPDGPGRDAVAAGDSTRAPARALSPVTARETERHALAHPPPVAAALARNALAGRRVGERALQSASHRNAARGGGFPRLSRFSRPAPEWIPRNGVGRGIWMLTVTSLGAGSTRARRARSLGGVADLTRRAPSQRGAATRGRDGPRGSGRGARTGRHRRSRALRASLGSYPGTRPIHRGPCPPHDASIRAGTRSRCSRRCSATACWGWASASPRATSPRSSAPPWRSSGRALGLGGSRRSIR